MSPQYSKSVSDDIGIGFGLDNCTKVKLRSEGVTESPSTERDFFTMIREMK